MLSYALRRIAYLVPVLLGVSIVSFSLLHLIPGDPAVVLAGVGARPEDLAGIRAEYGLDQPLPVQYVNYLSRAVRGDLGISIRTRDPVSRTLAQRIQLTIQLTLLSMALSIVLGVLAGVVAATHHNSWIDTSIMVTANSPRITHFLRNRTARKSRAVVWRGASVAGCRSWFIAAPSWIPMAR